jgi:hypothetical protein
LQAVLTRLTSGTGIEMALRLGIQLCIEGGP